MEDVSRRAASLSDGTAKLRAVLDLQLLNDGVSRCLDTTEQYLEARLRGVFLFLFRCVFLISAVDMNAVDFTSARAKTCGAIRPAQSLNKFADC